MCSEQDCAIATSHSCPVNFNRNGCADSRVNMPSKSSPTSNEKSPARELWSIRRLFPVRKETNDIRVKLSNLTRGTIVGNNVEIVRSSANRRKGLLGRDHLPLGEGLWIIPCESIHTFGMQFPIDLIYLDREQRVRKVRSNVLPWRLSVCLSAHSVIELPVGTLRTTGTKMGDAITSSE